MQLGDENVFLLGQFGENYDGGLMYFVPDTKDVIFRPFPLNFDNPNNAFLVHSTGEPIKRIEAAYSSFTNQFKVFIVDEPSFIDSFQPEGKRISDENAQQAVYKYQLKK